MSRPHTILVDLRAAQCDADRDLASAVQNLAAGLARTAADRRWLFLRDAALPQPTTMAELAARGEWCTPQQAATAPIDAVIIAGVFPAHPGCGAEDVRSPRLLARRPRRHCVVLEPVPWLDPLSPPAGARAQRRDRDFRSLLRGSDHLFGISRSTCDDIIRRVGIDSRRIHPIGRSIDEVHVSLLARPAAETADVPVRYGLTGPFCMSVGDAPSTDHEPVLRAFATFHGHHSGHRLAIVGPLSSDRISHLRSLAEGLGLPADVVLFTGAVNDRELVGLMRHTALLVHRAVAAGVGGPGLEAHGRGGSATCSFAQAAGELPLPEFASDPATAGEIAALMLRSVTDSTVAARSLVFGQELFARLGWSQAAATIMEHVDGRAAGPRRIRPDRPRLAVVAALPPARTAIAAYTLRHLQSDRWRTDFYDANPGPRVSAPAGLTADSRILPVEVLRPALDRGRHATVVHVLGNSEHHAKVLEAVMWTRSIPGVRRLAYLHEANLSSAFRSWLGDALDILPVSTPATAGPAWIRKAIAEHPDMGRCLRFLAERGELDGLIVNSAACRDLVLAATGLLADRWTIDVALLPIAEVSAGTAREPRHADELAVGTFGIAGDAKRLDCLARSVAHLGRRRPVRLVMAGWNMASYTRRIGIDSLPFVEVHDEPDDEEMRRLMGSVDVAVQLRNPTHGESSAAVAQLLAAGTPLVVTGEGSFVELPARLATFVPAECPPEPLADAIERAASRGIGRRELAAILAPLSAEAFTRRFAEIIAA